MRGFRMAQNPTAKFEPIGSIDKDPGACRNYARLVGSKQSCIDLFSRDQYVAFHGQEPDSAWRPVSLADFRAAYGNLFPDLVAMSSPCQGASGMLSNSKAQTPKYQALNELTLRGIFLSMEAWVDDPPAFIIFENVPRIKTRGRPLIRQIVALLDHYGYATQETVHDCGELGGLAQHRRRFFMVARHRDKVRPFLYVPPKKRVRAIREVLWDKPLPGDTVNGGKMHRMIRAQWKTWVRLALIPAGQDWRALKSQVGKWYIRRLDNEEVVVRVDPDIPGMGQHNHMRVHPADEPARTVTGTNDVSSGSMLVADDRMARQVFQVERAPAGDGPADPSSLATGARRGHNNVFVVLAADQAAPAVNGGGGPSSGAPAVADDRIVGSGGDPPLADPEPISWGDFHAYGVADPESPSETVTARAAPGAGKFSVADPRPTTRFHRGVLGVSDPDQPSKTVTTRGAPTTGEFSLADDRFMSGLDDDRVNYKTQGHYGVLDSADPSGAVTASGKYDNGRWSVADDRVVDLIALPDPDEVLDPWPIIIAPDGTVHRPVTTAELAWLQGLPLHLEDGSIMELEGDSSTQWRKWIGNMWPPPAAQAIGESMLRTLEMNRRGVGFALSSESIWVQPEDLVVTPADRAALYDVLRSIELDVW